jgi:hypothetical protein
MRHGNSLNHLVIGLSLIGYRDVAIDESIGLSGYRIDRAIGRLSGYRGSRRQTPMA